MTNDVVVLDHGTGAKLSQQLIDMITGLLEDVYQGEMEDSAVLTFHGTKMAMTTDSFVVDPLFFGNGDIGKLAVSGTVNDLAVMGARPLFLTLAMVIEEGFPIVDLKRIIISIKDAARVANVKIVAGDTKVVREGEVDKIFINTAGIGLFDREVLSSNNISAGDKLVLSGYIGDHSIHLLSLREGLGFESRVVSDCAVLSGYINEILSSNFGDSIVAMRDVTRGGLAEILHEFSQKSGLAFTIEESQIPIRQETKMAADMLGIDPIHLANEGCLCMVVHPQKVNEFIMYLREFEAFKNAQIIGDVAAISGPRVSIENRDGVTENLEQLVGAELPRLC